MSASRFLDNLGGDPAGGSSDSSLDESAEDSSDSGDSTSGQPLAGGGRAPPRGPDAPGGMSEEEAEDLSESSVQRTKRKLTPDRSGPGDQPSPQEKAAAGRQTRDFSSPGTTDRFSENLEDQESSGADLDPYGEPTTTQISAGSTGITVENIEGIGDQTAEDTTEALSTQATGGPNLGTDDPGETTIINTGQPDAPKLGEIDAPDVTIPNIEAPNIRIPDIPAPKPPDFSKLTNQLTLIGGFIAVLITIYVLGQLFNINLGGGSSA